MLFLFQTNKLNSILILTLLVLKYIKIGVVRKYYKLVLGLKSTQVNTTIRTFNAVMFIIEYAQQAYCPYC